MLEMLEMLEKLQYKAIPVKLTEEQFNQFFCPYLFFSKRGRPPNLSKYKYFCHILKFLYTGVQWKELHIEKDETGKSEINYSSIFRMFKKWNIGEAWERAFESSVGLLQQSELLDTSILHGDDTSTAAKKGGDNLGFNGHKHNKSEKQVAISDRNANIIAPFISAPGNRNETVLLPEALTDLRRIAKLTGINLTGSVMSLDGGYDSVSNRCTSKNHLLCSWYGSY